MNRKQLVKRLSGLKGFSRANPSLEQYPMDTEIVADILWYAYLHGDLGGKCVADLGCGNGVFGVGALLLGAKQVYFLDIDNDALALAKENSGGKGEFILGDVSLFTQPVNTVFMNPPFGVQTKHADKPFLEVAFRYSQKIYSFHKLESKPFISALSREYHWQILEILPYSLFLKKTMSFHTQKKHLVHIGCWILVKGKL